MALYKLGVYPSSIVVSGIVANEKWNPPFFFLQTSSSKVEISHGTPKTSNNHKTSF